MKRLYAYKSSMKSCNWSHKENNVTIINNQNKRSHLKRDGKSNIYGVSSSGEGCNGNYYFKFIIIKCQESGESYEELKSSHHVHLGIPQTTHLFIMLSCFLTTSDIYSRQENAFHFFQNKLLY